MKFILCLILAALASCCPINAPQLAPALRDETVLLIVDQEKTCTGVFIEDDLILTSAHCILDSEDFGGAGAVVNQDIKYNVATEVTKGYDDAIKIAHKAHPVKIDQTIDLAELRADGKIPTHGIIAVAHRIPAIGEQILIMGHPAGLAFSLQEGMVAAYRQEMPWINFYVHGPFMQIDGSLFNGDSGGAIVNKNGELVGICSFKSRDPHEGFATHLDTIRKFIKK